MTILTRVSCALRNVFLRPKAFGFGYSRLLLLALLASIAFQARAQTPVNLIAGWTLLGNSTYTALTVANVFGDQANVISVWKWVAPQARWAFYTPSASDGGAAYAASKGYDLLTSVNPGEGFWVNVKANHTAQLPAGTAVSSASFQNLASGWNLIAIGDNKTASDFNNALSQTPPSPGVIANNIISLWAWDLAQSNWYFYAPNLESNGTLASYIASKQYLSFPSTGIGPTMGIWVNAPANTTGTTTTVTTTTVAGTSTSTTSGTSTSTTSGTTTSTTSGTTTSTVVSTTTTTTVGGCSTVVLAPTGTAPIALTAATPPATFAALTPAVPTVAVCINSAPTVSFSLTDGNGNPIIGFGSQSQNATATVPSYPNLGFTLAKLVPGTSGAPSKWVSYIVTTVPTTTAASVPTRPGQDNTGTLVDHGNGTYTYTFYRDITKVKDAVAAATLTPPNVAADLGDLTYEPNLVHRLTIQISGNAPGTGTNTPNAVQVTTPLPMANPINVIHDFIPATGKAVTATDPSRDIVSTAKCNECHSRLGGIPGSTQSFHGGARVDARYCAVCHTDQRKYGRSEAATTATGYDSTLGTYLINGITVGDFPTMVHKTHMGQGLTKTGYNYSNVLFNAVTYPQSITNCVKCHDGSATSTAKTANGDNWKLVPTRLACGACHDGINFATGKGWTIADFRAGTAGTSYGHIGGAKANDSQCYLCHTAVDIPIYHITVDPTGAGGRGGYPLNTANDVPTPGYPAGQGPSIPLASELSLPAGAYKFDYEIKQVTVTGTAGTRKATVVYRILKDGQPVTFNATGWLINNVDGTPDIYVAYAMPQDGIVAPADWNTTASAHVIDIRDAKNGNSQTGPDASGYYTATLGAIIPDAATMVTAAIGINYNGFVQRNLAAYPKGIRLREPAFVMKVADGYTARRSIVSNGKCNSCHGQLGVEPSFHAGARNNGEGCAFCHDPNRATGHIGAANNFGGGWSVSAKNLVHSIHASSKRTQAFSYGATPANPNGYGVVTYPGVLKNCEQCHVAGSYDFSGTANNAALPNLLWTTDAKGNMTNDATTNPTSIAPIGLSPWVTSLGKGQINYTADNLVTSPIASTCLSCHDSTAAVTHMQSQGGTVYALFSSVASVATRPAVGAASTMTFTRNESCMTCHGPASVYGVGIKAVHAK